MNDKPEQVNADRDGNQAHNPRRKVLAKVILHNAKNKNWYIINDDIINDADPAGFVEFVQCHDS